MATWNLDTAHSEIEFKVRHMMISTVKGQFKNFEVSINSESDDISKGTVSVKIDTTSLDTKNEQRDQHLKSSDFFDATEFPTITFVSTSVVGDVQDEFKINGDLTVKGITKPIVVKAEFGGIAKDPWGNEKVGYTVKGAINRSDFGLTWNAALETGGVMVSEEVKFEGELQFVKS
ncbi:Polyisoprenoid-binding protein YceI [Sphingobacterium nematocida]|uniref:Polyisoprenoid-binding protein YceI n=1 Tax=Sphingobacterium nematocida TaxID=1513896 RepID=A0A1T5CMB7_9SPHI|nr:YceI family protein [Sphingobacterium nematocida]SKB60648.1 Polyisoprenoid-binding protein YceI [Sphingobacterium nematocida]